MVTMALFANTFYYSSKHRIEVLNMMNGNWFGDMINSPLLRGTSYFMGVTSALYILGSKKNSNKKQTNHNRKQ